MKTPENHSNKKPRKNSKIMPVSMEQPPQQQPQNNIPLPPLSLDNGSVIEIDNNMMKEILERAASVSKTQKIKRYVNEQKDAEALRSIIQEYFTSFILVGYSVDNKRLIVKSTNSDKDEDALLEELRYVCFKLSGG